jgi:hypothetical protein
VKEITNKILRVIISTFLALGFVFMSHTPVLAISNPDTIAFGSSTTYYKIFYNVLENDDWLIVAEGYVYYAVPPTDYSASEAFTFELLSADGLTTYAATPLQSYGDRPIGIYLSANQTATLGLTIGSGYKVRIMGNPLIFASPTGSSVDATLGSSSYIDQLLGDDGGIPTSNPLRNGMITVAQNMEANDIPIDSYLVTVQGYQYLSVGGADLFLEGIPSLSLMCPILFSTGIDVIESDASEYTGAYEQTLNPLQKWGTTVSNGLTALGSFMGINQALAGSVVLFVIVIMFAVFIYSKTESGITVLLMVSATPFLGAYLGLMPMALAFIFVIIIVTLLGYFFFSRGAL